MELELSYIPSPNDPVVVTKHGGIAPNPFNKELRRKLIKSMLACVPIKVEGECDEQLQCKAGKNNKK